MILKILSCPFTLTETSAEMWNENAMGRSDLKKGAICLKAEMPEEIKMQTLIHEIIHVLAGMNDLKIDGDEMTISTLASGLFDFFRQNPEIAQRILKGARWQE